MDNMAADASDHGSRLKRGIVIAVICSAVIVIIVFVMAFGNYVSFTSPVFLAGNDIVSLRHSDNGIISRTYYLSKFKGQSYSEQSCSNWDIGALLFGDPDEKVIEYFEKSPEYHTFSENGSQFYTLGYWAKTDEFYCIVDSYSDEVYDSLQDVPSHVLDVLRNYDALSSMIGSGDEELSAEIWAVQLWGNTWYFEVDTKDTNKDTDTGKFDTEYGYHDFVADGDKIIFESRGNSLAFGDDTWIRDNEPFVESDMVSFRTITRNNFDSMVYGRAYEFVGDSSL